MNVSDILNAAADDLEVNGWCIDDEGMRVAGPHCALGSIAHVSGLSAYRFGIPEYSYSEVEETEAVAKLASYLEPRVRPDRRLGLIYSWNDTQESAAPVIEALRAAAVIEPAREDVVVDAEAVRS